jgi:hypothetical protein
MIFMTRVRVRSFAAAAMAVMASTVAIHSARAQAESCRANFQKVMGSRQALTDRINGYRNKRPTPGQACSTLGQLVAADGKVLAWMTENKDWCQIPDSLIEQLQTSSGQASRSRDQACAAARRRIDRPAPLPAPLPPRFHA